MFDAVAGVQVVAALPIAEPHVRTVVVCQHPEPEVARGSDTREATAMSGDRSYRSACCVGRVDTAPLSLECPEIELYAERGTRHARPPQSRGGEHAGAYIAHAHSVAGSNPARAVDHRIWGQLSPSGGWAGGGARGIRRHNCKFTAPTRRGGCRGSGVSRWKPCSSGAGRPRQTDPQPPRLTRSGRRRSPRWPAPTGR